MDIAQSSRILTEERLSFIKNNRSLRFLFFKSGLVDDVTCPSEARRAKEENLSGGDGKMVFARLLTFLLRFATLTRVV